MNPLPKAYFQDDDVVRLSRDLIGKLLITNFNGERTSGIVIETEAYRAPEDRASHAFGNKVTKRNAVMYEDGGVAYVYLCYGIHHLFNIVTGAKGKPHAILIRSLHPFEGVDVMCKRRSKLLTDNKLCSGPGSLSQALEIKTSNSGQLLTQPPIWLEDTGLKLEDQSIRSAPRVGIDYAGEDAKLPWRFTIDPLAISEQLP